MARAAPNLAADGRTGCDVGLSGMRGVRHDAGMWSPRPVPGPVPATRVRTGALVKLGTEVIGRALQFALIYVAQRTLGPTAYGHFTVAVSAGLVLVPMADLGGQLTIARRLARGDEAQPAALVGVGLLARGLTVAVLSIPLLGVAAMRPAGVRGAAFLLGFAVLTSAFSDLIGYVFRGLHRVELDALLLLAARGLTVGLGLAALVAGGGLDGLAVAYLCGAIGTVAIGYGLLASHGVRPTWPGGVSRLGSLLVEAGPLGCALVLSMAYSRTGVFVLDAVHGAQAVGIYGVALKLTEPLAIVPAALLASLFPAVAREVAGGRDASTLRRSALFLLSGIAIVVAAAGVVAGPWLVSVLYGPPYAAAGRPLQVLAVATVPVFLNYALTHYLIAEGRERRFLASVATMFVVNFALCLAWIPRYGPTGAALAALTAEGVLFLLCWRARPGLASAFDLVGPRGVPYD